MYCLLDRKAFYEVDMPLTAWAGNPADEIYTEKFQLEILLLEINFLIRNKEYVIMHAGLLNTWWRRNNFFKYF